MSIEALNWALNDAPDVAPQLVAVLIGLANHAAPDGSNAFVSQGRLADYARKSDRAVRNDLKALLKLGLIKVSENQGAVAHLRADVRPVVYSLALHRKKSYENAGQSAPGSTLPGVGATAGSTVPNDRKHTSDEPSTNQTTKKTSSSSTRAPAPSRTELLSRFAEFWQNYPKPKDPGDAEKAWIKAVKAGANPDAIIDGARQYAAERHGQNSQYTKLPATWLNKRSWENAPEQLSLGVSGRHTPWQNTFTDDDYRAG